MTSPKLAIQLLNLVLCLDVQHLQLSQPLAPTLYHVRRSIGDKSVILQLLPGAGDFFVDFSELFLQSRTLRSNIDFSFVNHMNIELRRVSGTWQFGKRRAYERNLLHVRRAVRQNRDL